MTEIINLNKKRKQKNRIAKTQKSAKNRLKFGRTKVEKQKEVLEQEKLRQFVDMHKRECPPDDE